MRRSIVLLSVSLLTLTACTSTNHGNPQPTNSDLTQTPSSSTANGIPGPGVPKVENPINTTHFQQTPCDTLTSTQISELLGPGVTPKPDLKGQGGPGCNWDSPKISQAGVSVIFNKVNNAGLTTIYEKKGTTFPFFMPMESIDGYPAVAYGLIDERNTRGRCAIALGTSDRDIVDVSISQSEENIGKKDPCAAAHDVAAKVLENLRAVK